MAKTKHTHTSANAVPLVWGSLMLTPISPHRQRILHEKAPLHAYANESEFADLAFSNAAATICQCLSPAISKQDTNHNLGKTS